MTDALKFGGVIVVGLIFLIFFFSQEGSWELVSDIKKNIKEQRSEVNKNFKIEDDPAMKESLKETIISDSKISEIIIQISEEFDQLKGISQ